MSRLLVTAEDVPLMETSRDVLGQVVEQKLVNELMFLLPDMSKTETWDAHPLEPRRVTTDKSRIPPM
jgi:hypothetical protein